MITLKQILPIILICDDYIQDEQEPPKVETHGLPLVHNHLPDHWGLSQSLAQDLPSLRWPLYINF